MFSQVQQHLDARVGALLLAFDDLVKGGFANVTKVDSLPGSAPEIVLGPGVGWEAYIKFHLLKAKEAMAAYASQEAQAQALLTPAGVDAPPTDESQGMDVIFGGDQEHVEVSTGYEASSQG